jgi:CarD family transcriptional regulator
MAARKKTSKKASKPETEPPIPATIKRTAKRPASARRSRAGGSTEKKSSSAADGAEAARRAAAERAVGASGLPTGKAAIDRKPARTSAETAEAELKVKALEPSADKPAAVAATAVSPAPSALETETAMRVSAAVAARPPVVAKEPKTPSSTRSNERDEQGGEQKNMKNTGNRTGFKLNEFVVYPAHGVGQIVAMEEQEVAGFKLELFVINFTKDKMTLRVPTSKVTGVGMRKLSEPDVARRSLEILTGRARIKRTMWSRRAQEYEAKINSGDINAIAEVVRDLFRSEAQPEQSYSERQLYEAALDRLMREIAAVQKLTDIEALKVIEAQLMKNQKRTPKPDAAEGEEPEVEEAA